MKHNLHKTAAIIAFYAVFGCTSLCFAQQGISVGGFRDEPVSSAAVTKAADYAVKTQRSKDATLKLVSVLKAERQVVQGSNYRMCLAVLSKGAAQQVSATVYVNLKHIHTLSKWTAENCGGDAEETTDKGKEAGDEDDLVTYTGTLQTTKTDSAIVYLGEETGDLAAFCFKNDSAVGQAVLAKCKKGGQCEFTGTVDWAGGCKIEDERDLSASGRIISITSVKPVSAAADPKAAAGTISADDVE